MRSSRTIGSRPATRSGLATLTRSLRLARSKVRDGRAQLSQQGIVAIKRAAVPMFEHMKAIICQAGSSRRQTGGMVLRPSMIMEPILPTIAPSALAAVDGRGGSPAR